MKERKSAAQGPRRARRRGRVRGPRKDKEDFGIEDVSLVTKGDLTEKEYLGAKPLTVFEDNVGCISLSKNPVMHRASKHIEIRYHFVREKVQDGSLKLVYIPSSENIADVLTKSTRKNTFVYLRDKFMHSPQRTPHEALIARRALIAELVQETVRMNEGSLNHGPRIGFDLWPTSTTRRVRKEIS